MYKFECLSASFFIGQNYSFFSDIDAEFGTLGHQNKMIVTVFFARARQSNVTFKIQYSFASDNPTK